MLDNFFRLGRSLDLFGKNVWGHRSAIDQKKIPYIIEYKSQRN